MAPTQNQQIADYYDQTLPYYEHFWHKNSYGIHYGFWDKDTRTLPDALLNQNRFMAEILKLKPGNYILDAGCGVGGSSIWLAENYDVKVTGITLSKRQIAKARQLTHERALEDKVDYALEDYLHTKFPKTILM